MSNVIQFPELTEGPPVSNQPRSSTHPLSIMDDLMQKGQTFRVPTGWKTFDEASNGGFIYGHCTFICGAPNSGKTAILACLTEYWTKLGIPVCAYMVDEDTEDFWMRWATMLGYNMSQCDERKKEMLIKIGDHLGNRPFR